MPTTDPVYAELTDLLKAKIEQDTPTPPPNTRQAHLAQAYKWAVAAEKAYDTDEITRFQANENASKAAADAAPL